MAGALIVDDVEQLNFDYSREIVMLFQHLLLNDTNPNHSHDLIAQKCHSKLNMQPRYDHAPPLGWVFLNGEHQPTLALQPGETVRLRMINAGHLVSIEVILFRIVFAELCRLHFKAAVRR